MLLFVKLSYGNIRLTIHNHSFIYATSHSSSCTPKPPGTLILYSLLPTNSQIPTRMIISINQSLIRSRRITLSSIKELSYTLRSKYHNTYQKIDRRARKIRKNPFSQQNVRLPNPALSRLVTPLERLNPLKAALVFLSNSPAYIYIYTYTQST